MKTGFKTVVLAAIGAYLVLLATAACRGEPGPTNSTLEAPSGRIPNATVSGAVTYRERLALTAGATLVVELRDVSYADGPAPLIARQTISGPGQVPIKFRVEYNRADIDARNRYAVLASIIESDGSRAFVNDTAYEVITRGNPHRVDMLLVLVEPPPGLVGDSGGGGSDWRTWVEVPVSAIWANLIPNEAEPMLRVGYYQSTMEGCARPGNQELELDGYDIMVRVTLMQPPSTAWAIPCHERVVELDAVEPIGRALVSGQTYRVMVNGVETTTFTLPTSGLGNTLIAESAIESAALVMSENVPVQYQLQVVSGLSRGGRCSQFNGYEIRRGEPTRTEVVITHHEAVDPLFVCTDDYPVVETTVPLGSGFESGVEYTVSVNGDTVRSFVAR